MSSTANSFTLTDFDQTAATQPPQGSAPISDQSLNISQVETIKLTTGNEINIAVFGCVHGELDKLYTACDQYMIKTNKQIHIVICCGDFESMRNLDDLVTLHCPQKYKNMVDFYNYYNGNKTAPILTLFTHGNHEASNYLMELPYGGWVAPNIYFMGFTNVVNFYGVMISSIGGILKYNHYNQGRHETCPFDRDTMISLYHTREIDTWMLQQYSKPLDVLFSHDWPHTAATKGDLQNLLQMKPLFAPDIANNQLGSKYHTFLLNKLRPLYWFSAHLHCKHAALYIHLDDKDTNQPMPNQTALTDASQPVANFGVKTPVTKFLALDKIIPGRHFMHVLSHQIGPTSSSKDIIDTKQNSETALNMVKDHFQYDSHWVDILQTSQPFYPRQMNSRLSLRTPMKYELSTHTDFYKQYDGICCSCIVDSTNREDLFVTDIVNFEKQLYPNHSSIVSSSPSMVIPQHTFVHTAPPLFKQQPRPQPQHQQRSQSRNTPPPLEKMPHFQLNPQTMLFCNQFQLLIPVFYPQVHWCSPKHAAQLYKQQQQHQQQQQQQQQQEQSQQ